MPIFDNTPGGETATSFASADDFRDYAASRFPPAPWAATATDELVSALLMAAARLLCASVVWTSPVSTATQALPWPKRGALDRNGRVIAEDVIPSDLIAAQCELAVQLFTIDLLSDNVAAKLGVASVAAGPVSVAFQRTGDGYEAINAIVIRESARFQYTNLPRAVLTLLVPSWYVEAQVMLPILFEATG